MLDINPSTAELQRIINEELRLSNVFVNRLLDFAKVHGWGDKQTLAQLVVILGRENNRLQDELLKAEYAKAYPEQVAMDEDAALLILSNAITELKLARSER